MVFSKKLFYPEKIYGIMIAILKSDKALFIRLKWGYSISGKIFCRDSMISSAEKEEYL